MNREQLLAKIHHTAAKIRADFGRIYEKASTLDRSSPDFRSMLYALVEIRKNTDTMVSSVDNPSHDRIRNEVNSIRGHMAVLYSNDISATDDATLERIDLSLEQIALATQETEEGLDAALKKA